MVMREMPAVSVWPTVSESMLKARRRNSDATRLSTPGLSSTWTTKVHHWSAPVSASTLGRRIIACRSAPAGTIG